ncbi:ABC transporter permease [Microbacterium allomyrinae]|uniref:ABC transporter permease n=1 Tax=Microbacterium allomyrinae TaxID=2830666 RepID=A0A9X1S4R6_9MICO|nr:ABC transporter permease [Microbacterium allomyrinae]MCC2033270.1 ABC transporter permease [Microbacterium allomyrinae]
MSDTRTPMTATVALRRRSPRVRNLTSHAGLVVVLLLLVVVTAIGSDVFFTAPNVINVLRQVSVLAVIAAGLTVLMISGGIDFSMGSNAIVTMAVVAQLIAAGVPSMFAVAAGVAIATVIGLVNGLIITLTRAAAFVVTLATATLLDGLALLVLDGLSVSAGEELSAFGSGGILGLPYLLIIAIVVMVVLGLTLKYTMFGRDAFAIGGNEAAARLSGIAVNARKVALYALMGLLAGVAGVMLLGRLGAASPGVSGLTMELQAVAAVVIGGTSLAGGKGTMTGTALGVLLLGVLANALNLLGVSSYLQIMAVGAVLLIAAIANSWRGRR